MLPLSAIAPVIHSYDLRPAEQVGSIERMPGVDGVESIKGPSEIGPTQTSGESFANVLGRMVNEVNARQSTANDAVAALQSGQTTSLHQAVISMEEANISFQLMVEVRNKLLESYQELMRMQI
jgi:flagellar hook-basal body complex protein FliE